MLIDLFEKVIACEGSFSGPTDTKQREKKVKLIKII
jgi:hypothetical protein